MSDSLRGCWADVARNNAAVAREKGRCLMVLSAVVFSGPGLCKRRESYDVAELIGIYINMIFQMSGVHSTLLGQSDATPKIKSLLEREQ